jgi:hypothetical protein
MSCSGTTIEPNIISDYMQKSLSRLALRDFTMQFNCSLVIGPSPLASSVCTVLLDEIYTSLLRIWVEVMEADEKVYTRVWYRHL